MGLDQIKKVYISEEYGKKCIEIDTIVGQYGPFLAYDNNHKDTIEVTKEMEELRCEYEDEPNWHDTGIYLYKGKFFGKRVEIRNLTSSFYDDKEYAKFNDIFNQLKAKYPKGKISYESRKGPIKGQNYKYPSFEYESNNIKIFTREETGDNSLIKDSDSVGLYFFNPKDLKEVLRKAFDKKAEEEKQEAKKKELKKPF